MPRSLEQESDGQVVLVTGAASGIGLAATRAFCQQGARVVGFDINPLERGALRDFANSRGSTDLWTVDVSDVAAARTAVSKVFERHGRLDVLVNSAGITRALDFFEVGPRDWDRIHLVNSRGAFFVMQSVARYMVQRRTGSIVNVASIGGKGFRGTSNVAYAASKAAVLTFTRIAAQVLATHNVRVNAVCPGVVETPMRDDIITSMMKRRGVSRERALQDQLEMIPLRRVSTAEDVAEAIVFLASSCAATITGQCMDIDGGLML